MGGETDLARLLAGIDPGLRPGVFVFATLPPGAPIPAGLAPLMTFAEAEGMTLVLERGAAEAAGLAAAFPCRQITLGVHSALAAVGLTARVATALAEAGIPANIVAAFHHDHLFVPEDRATEALDVLRALSGGAGRLRPHARPG